MGGSLVLTGAILYSIGHALFAPSSPYKVRDKSFDRVRSDKEASRLQSTPALRVLIVSADYSCVRRATSRIRRGCPSPHAAGPHRGSGRWRQAYQGRAFAGAAVGAVTYRLACQVQYHVSGPRSEGNVYAEAKQSGWFGGLDFNYIIVGCPRRKPIFVVDNRSADVATVTAPATASP